MKQALIVFGTRPEYLKLKPLVQAFQHQSIPFTFLQVLQHENLQVEEASEAFFQQVHLLTTPSVQRLTNMASSISIAVEPFVLKSNCVFIQGDTATAFFTAISAFHCQVPIFHVEAGLRTFDLANPFPEEAYRSMVSRIATYHLCPDKAAKQHLLNENITENIFVVGNTILDLVKSYKMTPRIGNIVLITVHRRENWNQLPRIVDTIHCLAKQRPDLQFVWIYHPNPILQECVSSTIQNLGDLPNLLFEQPCSHKQLCQYIHDSYCIITDSGGIQEEASFAGKFSFVLRKVTERDSIPHEYIRIVDSPESLLSIVLSKTIHMLPSCTVYGEGNASHAIVTILRSIST